MTDAIPQERFAVDEKQSRAHLVQRANVDVDTSQLCRMLSQMNASLAKLQENQHATQLNRALTCEEQEAEELRRRIFRLEKNAVAAASREDVDQLKEYVKECIKTQADVAATTLYQIERKLDGKVGQHVDVFGKWQADLMEVSSGRIEALMNRLDATEVDIDGLRVATNRKLQEGDVAAGVEKERTTRELATCKSLIHSLDSTVQTLVERIQRLEQNSVEQQRNAESFAEQTRQDRAKLHSMVESQETRMKCVEDRLQIMISQVIDQQAARVSKMDAEIAAVNARLDNDKSFTQDRIQEMNDQQRILIQSVQELLQDLSSRFEQRAVADDERNQKVSQNLEDLEARFEAARSENIALSDDVHQRAKEHFASKLKVLEQGIEKIRERNAREDEIGLLERLEEAQAKSQDDVEALRKELVQYCANETDRLSAHIAEQQSAYHEQVKTDISERMGGVDLASLVTSVKDVDKRLDKTANQTDTMLREVQLKMVKTQADIENVVVSAKVRQSSNEKKMPPRPSSLRQGSSDTASSKVPSSLGNVDRNNELLRRITLAKAAASEQESFVEGEARRLAQACLDYEAKCIEEENLVKFPHEIIQAISAAAIEMAAFVAEKTDCWIVTQYIDAPDTRIGEIEVEEKRQEEHTYWLRAIQEAVASLAASSATKESPLRNQARDWVLARIAKTFDFCLSKHDSVMVTKTSDLSADGRNAPVNVARDRPLPTRKGSSRSKARPGTFSDDANKSSTPGSGRTANQRTRSVGRGSSDRQSSEKDEKEDESLEQMQLTDSSETNEGKFDMKEPIQRDSVEIDTRLDETNEQHREHRIERWCAEWT